MIGDKWMNSARILIHESQCGNGEITAFYYVTVNSLPNIKLRTTHRMKGDTLKQLIKLGAGAIKKKKGKGKKKKVAFIMAIYIL